VVEAASAERGGRGEVTVRVMIHDHRALIQFDVAGPDAVFALAKNALGGMNPLDPKQDQRNLTLVFSRRAARLLEGDITLLKLPGGGARFILSLPLQAVAIPKETF
jgi:hypothetical protein